MESINAQKQEMIIASEMGNEQINSDVKRKLDVDLLTDDQMRQMLMGVGANYQPVDMRKRKDKKLIGFFLIN